MSKQQTRALLLSPVFIFFAVLAVRFSTSASATPLPADLSVSLSDGAETRPWNGGPVELRASTDAESALISANGKALAITLTAPATEDLIMGALLLVNEQTFAIQSADTVTNIYSGGDIDKLAAWTLHTTLPNHPDGSATLSIQPSAQNLIPSTQHLIPNPQHRSPNPQIHLFGPESSAATLHTVALIDPNVESSESEDPASFQTPRTRNPSPKHTSVSIISGSDKSASFSEGTKVQSSDFTLHSSFSATAEKVTRARTRHLTLFNATR